MTVIAVIAGFISFSGFIILLSEAMDATPNLGRLFGAVEEWHETCDLALRGKWYNGRRTYYFLFIPLFRVGFYHSTSWRDW